MITENISFFLLITHDTIDLQVDANITYFKSFTSLSLFKQIITARLFICNYNFFQGTLLWQNQRYFK